MLSDHKTFLRRLPVYALAMFIFGCSVVMSSWACPWGLTLQSHNSAWEARVVPADIAPKCKGVDSMGGHYKALTRPTLELLRMGESGLRWREWKIELPHKIVPRQGIVTDEGMVVLAGSFPPEFRVVECEVAFVSPSGDSVDCLSTADLIGDALVAAASQRRTNFRVAYNKSLGQAVLHGNVSDLSLGVTATNLEQLIMMRFAIDLKTRAVRRTCLSAPGYCE